MRDPGVVWLFDLDNTLHDANPHIFPHINQAMNDYICAHLGVEQSAATQIRQDYWQRYGATLLGLMRNHGTDPEHFLWHTHQFPDLQRMVVHSKALKATLKRLPGKKIIFSNAPRHYTAAVLALTGIGPFFDAVYTVESVRYRPKPMLAGFLHLLRAEKLNPRRCVMVEDSLANLLTAKKLGMKTVWINSGSRQSPAVDVMLRHVGELPRQIARLR